MFTFLFTPNTWGKLYLLTYVTPTRNVPHQGESVLENLCQNLNTRSLFFSEEWQGRQMGAVEYENEIYMKCQMLYIAIPVPLFFLQIASTYFLY